MRTIFPLENDELADSLTDSAQNPPESENQHKVKFPKIVRNKKAKVEAATTQTNEELK